jgi:hypothetical protein
MAHELALKRLHKQVATAFGLVNQRPEDAAVLLLRALRAHDKSPRDVQRTAQAFLAGFPILAKKKKRELGLASAPVAPVGIAADTTKENSAPTSPASAASVQTAPAARLSTCPRSDRPCRAIQRARVARPVAAAAPP